MRTAGVAMAIVLAVVVALLSPETATAAPPQIVSAQIEPFVSTVGDRLTLTIVIDHDPGTIITGPGADTDFGNAALIEFAEPVTEPIPNSERERTTLTYTLTSFTTGSATLPRLEINWRTEVERGTLRTQEAPYTVDSVVAPGDNTIRPLKPQLDLAQPAPPPYVPATFVLMLAGLTAFGYWLIRRTIAVQPEPLRPVPAPAPPPTAGDIARRQLDAVAESGLEQTDPAEYYTRIAAITRSYLSDRFDFPAYAMTRREMEREMRRTGIDRWPARVTANLLEQCDAVEFARFRPATERRVHDLAAAYEIIDLTEHPPEPAAEA
jgi:hypothetical protein